MKRNSFLVLFFLGIFLWPQLAAAESVDIVTFSYPPYMNADGNGILARIIGETTKNTGIRVSYKVYPRKRAVLVFNQRETEGLFLGERGYFPDLKNFEVFTLLEFRTVFVYVKASHPTLKYKGLADLAGKRVGVSFGSVLIPLFKDYGMIVEEAHLENNLARLKTGRIDFWHTVDTAALAMIGKTCPGREKDFGFLDDETHTADLMVKKGSRSTDAFRTMVNRYKILEKRGDIRKLLAPRPEDGKP